MFLARKRPQRPRRLSTNGPLNERGPSGTFGAVGGLRAEPRLTARPPRSPGGAPFPPSLAVFRPAPAFSLAGSAAPPARYWSPPGTWRGARSGSLSPLLYSPPAPIGGRAGVPGPPIGCSAGRVPGLVGGCAAPRPAGGRAARLGWRVAGAARQRGAAGAESRAPAAAGWGARSGAWPRRAEPSRAQSGAASSMPPAAERGEPGGTSALAAAGSA